MTTVHPPSREGLGFFGDPKAAYEMKAPDGTTVYRVPFSCGGRAHARYKGRVYPILGGIRGPFFMSDSWGSWKV